MGLAPEDAASRPKIAVANVAVLIFIPSAGKTLSEWKTAETETFIPLSLTHLICIWRRLQEGKDEPILAQR